MRLLNSSISFLKLISLFGQCGNQIGHRFWDLALKEHASVNKKGLYDSALSTFFQNGVPSSMSLGSLPVAAQGLKARTVLVDMEEGVVSEILKGPLRSLFDDRQLITDVSGSGNNWAVGHCQYGRQYRDQLLESIRHAAEQCDCLQCFFILHSMGGGTGSGVGTFITSLLHEEFPDVYRFVTAVFPSEDDDVITSPYNSMLATRCLTEHADCVMPIHNACLADIVTRIETFLASSASRSSSSSVLNSGSLISSQQKRKSTTSKATTSASGKEQPFDGMNNIVANLLLNLTCSSRFEGTMNVDLNEISTNLVPFPRLHYLVASQSPLCTLPQVALPPRRIDNMFQDAFSKEHQMMTVQPKAHTFLACALLLRGNVDMSDIRRNIERLQRQVQFVPCNQDGWKVGHCKVPPSGQPYSLLTLSNNTCIRNTFTELNNRFQLLYRRKAHTHHYSSVEGFEMSMFDEALHSLDQLTQEYARLEKSAGPGGGQDDAVPERLKIAF